MPPYQASRGLRRAELVSSAPGDAAVFLQRLLGWLAMYAGTGFDCWVGERQCASIRSAYSGQPNGWHLVFANGAHDGSLTGPDNAHALIRTGRARHGPWAPVPRIGEPVWIDLCTTEAKRADAFWADMLCWTVRPEGDDAATYTADHRPIATRVPYCRADKQWGWLCYFAVGDIDAAGEQAEALGGQVLEQINHPVLGAALLVADPLGTVLAISRTDHSWGVDRTALSQAESSPST